MLALGAYTNYFNLPGLEEFSLAMKTLPDAVRLRAQIIQHLEDANSECILNDRRSLLTFVVAGGGFAGVETVASINDFVRAALKFYPNLKEEMLRVLLVHPGAVILPELGPELGRYAQTVLARQGVEILLNTRVTGRNNSQPPARRPALRKGAEPHRGQPVSPRAGLAMCLGRGRLCSCPRCQEPGQIPPAHGPTRHPGRDAGGGQHRRGTCESTAEGFFL